MDNEQSNDMQNDVENKGQNEMENEMKEAAGELNFEAAAGIRDRIKSIQKLKLSGDVDVDLQPEVFYVDPTRGLDVEKSRLPV